MSARDRLLATLEGRTVDRFPVAAPYLMLLQQDHWCELTGEPAWTWYGWLIQDPSEHVRAYGGYLEQLPFDILQPQMAPTRERRQALEVVERDGQHFYHDRRTGELIWLNEDLANANPGAHETRTVWDRADVDRLVKIVPAQELIERGDYDFITEAARQYGREYFVMNGVIGVFYQCVWYVGETNLFSMLYEEAALIEYLQHRLLEKAIEEIRALARAGVDAIYIDDALATCDMISPAHYERFSLPYMRAMVEEIHRLGKSAVLIYFGGIADRLETILSLGADALSCETSMKTYTNDLAQFAKVADGRTCLWGNLDPVAVVQNGSEAELRAAMAAQVAVGREAGRFIISTGSPITPLTSLARIRRFIELGWELGGKS